MNKKMYYIVGGVVLLIFAVWSYKNKMKPTATVPKAKEQVTVSTAEKFTEQ